mgnify:CR=1 FL=1
MRKTLGLLFVLGLAGCGASLPDARMSGVVDDTTPVRPTAQPGASVPPLQAAPGNPAPQVVTNSVGISDENDFEAVSGQRDIEADAELLERNRAEYVQVAPSDLPPRTEDAHSNIVAYALNATNPVGRKLYRRNPFRSQSKYVEACASFASADLAQVAFLSQGGPERDRLALDPDGDGYACTWSPNEFRAIASE